MIMLQSAAQNLDLLLSSFVFGATVWFFFVQSPALIKWMGRDKFVPIQMRLTKIFFRTLSWALGGVVILTLVSGGFEVSLLLIGAIVAFVAAVVEHFYVIPRALRAGGKGRSEDKDQAQDKSIGTFASEGSGPSASFWHRAVVLFVAIMLVGLVPHMIELVG